MGHEECLSKKKQPELVRRQLLDVAARLSLEQGIAAVTLDAVSQAAGVSKGGLLHHFPNKVALLDGLFDELVARFDRSIEEAMAADDIEKGRFTRAYLTVCFALDREAEAQGGRSSPSRSSPSRISRHAGVIGWRDGRRSSQRPTPRPIASSPDLPPMAYGSPI